MDTFLGIDPAMTATGWALIKKVPSNGFVLVEKGTIRQEIAGKGKWDAKIGWMADQVCYIALRYHPDHVIVEVPSFGSRGKKGAGAMVHVSAGVEAAWRTMYVIARAMPKTPMTFVRPDTRTKNQRANLVKGLVSGWPEKSRDHETDAAWAALRRT